VRKAWLTSLVHWITRHIEGHKDKETMHRLDRWESLNVEADNLARDFLAIARNKPRHFSLSLEPWSILVNMVPRAKSAKHPATCL